MTDQMTRADRDELMRVVRLRERVAKSTAAQRSAELLADFEANLAAKYAWADDGTWQQLYQDAQAQVQATDRAIAERCKALGIPPRFRPGVSLGWYQRGENGSRERRAELRTVAKTRLAAMEKAAKAAIERSSVEIQTQLVAGGLASDEARAFLTQMPTIEALMPPLDVKALEAAVPSGSDRLNRMLGAPNWEDDPTTEEVTT